MENKFFRLVALLLVFSSSLSFAAKHKKSKYSIKTSSGGVVAEGKLKQIELEVPVDSKPAPKPEPAGEAADGEERDGPRYEISAIEDAAEGKNYYITRDENNNFSFVQKLSWNKISDIKHYHITIEKDTEEGWIQVLEKDLNENKIELSLESGKYRFQIGVVNLFDQLEKSSEWKHFEVLKATQPKIEMMQTDSIYLNSKKATGIFTLKGENLTAGTKFTMEQRESDPPKIITGTVLSVSPDGERADVKFNIEEMSEGKYEIYAQNPGGLSVISKTINIKNKKERRWRFLASLNYAFPFTFYDGTLNKYTAQPFYPISGGARLELISFHTSVGDIGFGTGGYFSRLQNDTDTVSMNGYFVNALGYLVYHKYLIPEKLCLDFHAGAGAAALVDMRFENKVIHSTSSWYIVSTIPPFSSVGIAFGGGLGVQYYLGKHFYLEGNLDYVHAKFEDMSVGMVYPSLGFGGKF